MVTHSRPYLGHRIEDVNCVGRKASTVVIKNLTTSNVEKSVDNASSVFAQSLRQPTLLVGSEANGGRQTRICFPNFFASSFQWLLEFRSRQYLEPIGAKFLEEN